MPCPQLHCLNFPKKEKQQKWDHHKLTARLFKSELSPFRRLSDTTLASCSPCCFMFSPFICMTKNLQPGCPDERNLGVRKNKFPIFTFFLFFSCELPQKAIILKSFAISLRQIAQHQQRSFENEHCRLVSPWYFSHQRMACHLLLPR